MLYDEFSDEEQSNQSDRDNRAFIFLTLEKLASRIENMPFNLKGH
ncbi:hypothetical protein DET65_1713 [Sunxiuqinia elliptica]|uniref:Uncharacterized protein n=1 Tax=Sunxiuqinia elliptica TaxID=655355 RepID=A0A4R6H805_9BACT|nr:hypothetical protein DET52_10237 [Sunxiuqinia elliptica]TDO61987.1 hypothetical protein DET65_1713 [Sunxiuqinia elliptica]